MEEKKEEEPVTHQYELAAPASNKREPTTRKELALQRELADRFRKLPRAARRRLWKADMKQMKKDMKRRERGR